MKLFTNLRAALLADKRELTGGITPVRVLYAAMLALTALVLGLCAFGPWGTKPATAFPIVGKQTVIGPDGATVLEMDVDEAGFAKVVYRGVLLVGQLTRSMADQDTSIYSLSYNNIKGLDFSFEVPTNYNPDSPTGVWAIRMHNSNAQETESSSEFEWLFLEKTNRDLESKQYEAFDENGPRELYDWLYLDEDGIAKIACLDFIPENSTNESIKSAARSVAWTRDDGTVTLSELDY